MPTHRFTPYAAAVWCILLLTRPAAAQEISGYIIDDTLGVGISGVAIAALDSARIQRAITYSDSTGWFAMRLFPGTFVLSLSRIGYADLTTEFVRLSRGEALAVELRMGANAIPVEPLVVRSRTRTALLGSEVFHKRMAQQRALGHGRFITREEIDRTSVRDVNELLTRDPSLTVMPLIREGGQTIMSTIDVLVMRHAGRKCLPALFIDGIRIRRNEETDLSGLLQPETLEGVEIYPSSAFTPPELADDTGCGSVALWTRRTEGSPITLRRIIIAAGIVAGGLLIIQ